MVKETDGLKNEELFRACSRRLPLMLVPRLGGDACLLMMFPHPDPILPECDLLGAGEASAEEWPEGSATPGGVEMVRSANQESTCN